MEPGYFNPHHFLLQRGDPFKYGILSAATVMVALVISGEVGRPQDQDWEELARESYRDSPLPPSEIYKNENLIRQSKHKNL